MCSHSIAIAIVSIPLTSSGLSDFDELSLSAPVLRPGFLDGKRRAGGCYGCHCVSVREYDSKSIALWKCRVKVLGC